MSGLNWSPVRILLLAVFAFSPTPTSAEPGDDLNLSSKLPPLVKTIDAGDPVDHVFARGDCVNAAVGSAGALLCGDLQVGHALPPIRSMNRTRGLSLLYTSDHGRPHPIVNADVTLPSTATVPDSVVGVLFLTPHGATRQQVGRQKWNGTTWSPGATRRVAVSGDWLKSTGIYSYTLEVTNWYGTSGYKASISGQRIVVDRRTSPYGTGWWLSGLEQLVTQPDGTLLWVGGDGSARRYVSAGSGIYLGNNRSRPDTISFNGSEYARHVPGKVRVYFNSAGRHIRTTDAAGLTTTFAYNSYGGVYRITLPSGSDVRRIDLSYNSAGKLYRVNTHGRYVYPTVNSSGLLSSIKDPDGTNVSFGYSSGRMTWRTDRRGYRTYYYYDAAKRISRVRLDMPSPQADLNTYFRVQRSQGRAVSGSYGPVSPGSAHTYINGPRTDVTDIHRFYENAHGQPFKVQDAIGAVTETQRGDNRWPALVTWSKAPSGQIIASAYDSGGRLSWVEDRSMTSSLFPSNGSTYARTTYAWNTACSMPSKVTSPMGDFVQQGYTAKCRVAWRQERPEIDSRTSFGYDSYGRVTWVQPPEDGKQSVTYDGRYGNISTVRDHLGNTTYHYQDGWGRDTLVVAPVDASRVRKVKTAYDAAGRDSLVTTIGDETRYSWSSPSYRDVIVPSDTMWVRNLFDAEGNLLSVARTTFGLRHNGGVCAGGICPESVSGGEQTLAAEASISAVDTASYEPMEMELTRYRYDAAGRQVWSWTAGKTDSTVYDLAGNATLKINRSGFRVSMAYDANNRLTRKISEAVSYPRTCLNESLTLCKFYYYPYYPNDGGDGLFIPADTSVFAYDISGNLVSAGNAVARVGRTYYQNGQLRNDTLRIAKWGGGDDSGSTTPPPDDGCFDGICPTTVQGAGRPGIRQPQRPRETSTLSVEPLPGSDSDFSSHVYVSRYTYDQNGRVATMAYPSLTRVGTVTYQYHPWGPLKSISASGNSSHAFGFSYDYQNRRILATYPGGGNDATTYDDLGRITRRYNYTPSRTIHDDRYTPDLMGRTVELQLRTGWVKNWYSSTTPLLAVQWQRYGDSWPGTEEFWIDPAGMLLKTRRDVVGTTVGAVNTMYSRVPGGPLYGLSSVQEKSYPDETTTEITRDAAGSITFKHILTVDVNGASQYRQTDKSYYDGLERLAVFQRNDQTYEEDFESKGVFEEYRYGPLGRRVVLRSRKDGLSNEVGKVSYIQRFIWAGDQLSGEVRAKGGNSATVSEMESDYPSGRQYGRVGYVHAGGIDQPISIFRGGHPNSGLTYVVPHVNWRGMFDFGTTPSGAECTNSNCAIIIWPGDHRGVYGDTRDNTLDDWMGSLADAMADESRLDYRRNRYYDPGTGEFTQIDPIGVAGGLNLYGYAAGDPLSYSDPFGLCPDPGDIACQLFESGMTALGATIGFLAGGGGGTALAFATGGVGAAAVPAGAAQGAALGASAGFALGRAMSSVMFREGGGGGFDNIRFLNKHNVKGSQVSVDLERGGSGSWRVQVHVGDERHILNSMDDVGQLPKSIRKNGRFMRSVQRAFDRLDEINQ